jgi:NADH dehydrogenase FAD-containing subunit
MAEAKKKNIVIIGAGAAGMVSKSFKVKFYYISRC